MAKRVSHSVLDPWISPLIKALYHRFPIPPFIAPEAIVLAGHLAGILAAIGFAFAATAWWGGLLVMVGVAGNHAADILDGTHARATGQCRNGGELLDHFTDPLSFSYWLVGMAVACGRLDLGIAAVICLYATSVLTNIKAKMIGEFTLASFGPTEFKSIMAGYGVLMATVTLNPDSARYGSRLTLWFFVVLIVVGVVQLIVNLAFAIREVNASATGPDTSDWETVREKRGPADP